MMDRRRCWMKLMLVLAFSVAGTMVLPLTVPAQPSAPKELRTLFDKKEYQKALDEIGKLGREQSALPDVRRIKIRSLLRIGNPKEAVEEYDKLEASLHQDDFTLLREVALGCITVLVKDMREQMRGAAYTALKEIESDDLVPWLEDGLSDGSAPVRMLAVEGLSRLEKGRKSPKLRAALDDQAGLVKAKVVKVLGRQGDPASLPLVEAAAKDDLNTVRIAAYAALIRLGQPQAWEQLKQAADAPNPEDRAEALKVMADLKDQRAVPFMLDMLTYKQPSVRAAAARSLGNLGRKEAREKIERLLLDPVSAVRESATTGLADLGGGESVPALTKSLNDNAFNVRAASVAALLQLGQPFDLVAPTVRNLAQQSDPGSRAAIAHALGKATKPNLGGALSFLTALAGDPLPTPKILAVRSLGHVGNREMLPTLKEALHDPNEAVRATAGGAICRVLRLKT